MTLPRRTGSGFRIDRENPRCPTALGYMRDAGVWSRIESCPDTAWERLSGAVPGIRTAGTVHVVLVLGEPGHAGFYDAVAPGLTRPCAEERTAEGRHPPRRAG
ncbi:hypothetical protein EDD95_7103 [Streptomyces sp. CEV 2-1]|nr:hypothetical protein EDD95_7103 [Streptomyces sp. CEV 2-1]